MTGTQPQGQPSRPWLLHMRLEHCHFTLAFGGEVGGRSRWRFWRVAAAAVMLRTRAELRNPGTPPEE